MLEPKHHPSTPAAREPDSLSEKAVTIFNQKPKQYNCAQTVAKAFDREDLLEPLMSCGGGKAPGGLCGALYAATLIAGNEKSEAAKEQFQKTIGYQECKSIRRSGQSACGDCVRCAAAILEADLKLF